MSRQHSTPILIGNGESPAAALTHLGPGDHGLSEADIQSLIQLNPQCLPIAEIDPIFANPVPVCTELNVQPAGSIDNFMVTASGLPVLVECKLWKNPEARREVVGQILDYAQALSRWTASDLLRETRKRLKRDGNVLLDLVRAAGHDVDEIAFNDALTLNLRRGRFLLLIVGDGIREGVEAIAGYLQQQSGLHFTLGLVELPLFALPDGRKVAVPRVLARTELLQRTVIELPDGLALEDGPDDIERSKQDNRQILAEEMANPVSRIRFWTDMAENLTFDDPDVSKPRPGRNGFLTLTPPFKIPSTWITLYRVEMHNEVGVNIKFSGDATGESLVRGLFERWPDLMTELGESSYQQKPSNGGFMIGDHARTGAWSDERERQAAFKWLRRRSNDFVNVFFPKLKILVEELSV